MKFGKKGDLVINKYVYACKHTHTHTHTPLLTEARVVAMEILVQVRNGVLDMYFFFKFLQMILMLGLI